MALPEVDITRARHWVEARIAGIGELIDEMRVEMDVTPRAITILECRPAWREAYGPGWTRQEIARLRYSASTSTWTLYWPDRDSDFHRYEGLMPTPNLHHLLDEVDADPTCIFWG